LRLAHGASSSSWARIRFTWAQTKLGNAAAHLDHFAQGKWEEPK
jgi:hypothetical protein